MEDVPKLARENQDFRRVLFTTKLSQVVLMSVPPGEETGEETHEGIDQMLSFVDGEGGTVLGDERRERAVSSWCLRLVARAGAIDVRTDAPQITFSPDGRTATIQFRKTYQVEESTARDAVTSELKCRHSGDGWRIISERDLGCAR